MSHRFWKALLASVIALTPIALHAQTAINRANLENLTNADIRANGAGLITGPLLNTVLNTGWVSMCTLNDACTWNQLQTFAGGISVDLNTVTLVNNITIQHGGTSATSATGARVNLGLETITTVGDANYQMLVSDRNVNATVTLSAVRTWTLPAANGFNPGQWIYVNDQRGTVSSSHYISIAPSGSDTINGVNSAISMNQQFGGMYLQSDGISRWTAYGKGPAIVDTLNATSIPAADIAAGTAGINISGNAATASSAAAVSFNNGLTTSAAVGFKTESINGGPVTLAYAGFAFSASGSFGYAAGVTGYGSSGAGMYFQPNNATYTNITFENASAGAVGSITGTATATAYNTSSDRRLKQNITPSQYGLSRLMQIPVRDFEFINDPTKRVQGFIAQELEPLYPEAVTTNGDDGTGKLADKSKAWGVDYGRMTPLLVLAIQDMQHELASMNDVLEHNITEIAKLQDQVDDLKGARK